MASLLIFLFAAILLTGRPWCTSDEEWFRLSAQLGASLASALPFSIA